MTFKDCDPNDCLQIIKKMEDADLWRRKDRATINAQFNGGRPFTDDEVKEFQIQVNANFLEGYKVALDANQQANGALLYKDKFFNVRCLSGKVEEREELGRKFADAANKVMKEGPSSRAHNILMRNRNAALTLHGIGAMVWLNSYDWMPRFAALDDLLIPTNASQDLDEELGHFGLNAEMTAYQLIKLTHGASVDKGWDVEMVRKVVKSINELQQYTVDLNDQPEKWESLLKEHGLYLDSDAVQKIKITYFFHQNEEDGTWYRKVLLRKTEAVTIPDDAVFLYKSDKPFAQSIDEVLHVQFGDGNVVAPLKFHSVRGLGQLLYSVVELMNRFRCQLTQSAFESLMTLMRIQNPSDRDRPKVLQLHSYAVVEDGVSFIPQEERNKPDAKLVESALAQGKQLIAESSSSYVQDVDTGSGREQTLGEAKIKLQSANKIVAGMLSNLYLQEFYYYKEVVRRLLKDPTPNKDSESFKRDCMASGIPKEFMEPKHWKVEVEKVFGMGDQTLAIEEITAIMGIINQLDPSAQRIVRRKYIAVITRNSDLANILVPQDNESKSKGWQAAEDVFATLMRGIPVSLREGIEQQDYVISMAEMMAQEISRIQQTDNMGTPQDVVGLQTVAQDIEQHMNILAQDQANKDLVTGMGKAVGKMMNDVKGFAQRQQQAAEAAAKEQMQDPEAMAKIQALQMQAQIKSEIAQQQAEMKAQIKTMEHQMKMRHTEESHALQMQTASGQASLQMSADQAKTQSEIQLETAKTEAEIQLEVKKTAAAIQNQQAKTQADVAASRVKAEASAAAKTPKEGSPAPKAPAPAAPAKPEKSQPINLTVNMPKSGKTRVVFERDSEGKIIGATKETE